MVSPEFGLICLSARQFEGLRRAIAWLMGLLIARHPDSFEKAQHVDEQMVRFYESAPKDELGRPAITHFFHEGKRHELDNSDWAELRDATNEDVQQRAVEDMRNLTITLTKDIFKKFAIIVAPDPIFVTSDRPVYLIHRTRKRFGVRTPGMRLMFPLSPTHNASCSRPSCRRAEQIRSSPERRCIGKARLEREPT